MSNLPDAHDELAPEQPGFLVVGLGASAGGIEALREFFANVAADSGLAYVVILHLSPEYESQLAQLLQTVTSVPVMQVAERVRVEPNRVYVIPPNQHLTMIDGDVAVSRNTQPEERRAPIDIFFRTLAESHHARAVCVVLSGSGSDGSMGLKRVKERGGAVFVQEPHEAAFDEMPRSAIATGLVDDALPVAMLPVRVASYATGIGTVAIPVEPELRPEDQQQALREVLTQLRVRTGHDFSNYKRPTLLRRIERRITVRNLPDLPAYAALVREQPDEIQALLKDLLISVTNFFRDPEAFTTLEQEILPRLFQDKHAGDQLRIWVVGCATGEEAYSIAMLCAERILDILDQPKVQIFATDIDDAALAHARAAMYTASDVADVSPERLRRFFSTTDQRFQIRREIREMVLFANHNVLKDPPFSHQDLITCRNLLIYLNQSAQERVLESLHFALDPGAYLFLGTAESVDVATDLYGVISRRQRIFQRRPNGIRPFPVPETTAPTRPERPRIALPPPESDERMRQRVSYGELHHRLLEHYAPPSLVVNQNFEIVHLSEQVSRYLHLPAGALTSNLFDLVRPELRVELRTALYQAMQQQSNVDASNLPIVIDGRTETVTIRVRPVLRHDEPAQGYILVLFEQGAVHLPAADEVQRSDEAVTQQLEAEVQRLRVQLRTSSEQYEVQTEELKATNEELQALNEELHSAAEELETSREELQSINEELRTVNQELKIKVEEATLTSANLRNLVDATDIATIFLDRSTRIRLFTPAARALFNLIPGDYGRPLSDITHRFVDANVRDDVEMLFATLQPVVREVRTIDGQVFLMRVLPYRVEEDRIGGVVLTFVGITERKHVEEALRASEERQAFLLRLSDGIRPLAAAADIQAAATRITREFFNADRCYYCEIEQGTAIIRRDASRPGLPSVVGEYALNTMPIFKAVIDAGQPFVVTDAYSTDLLDEPLRQLCIQLQVISFLDVPVIKDGRPLGVLCITQATPREWSPFEIELAVESAERIWGAVERAHAEEALRTSEQRLQRMVNVPSVGVLTFDYAGELLHANDAFLDMLGYTREEFALKTFTWRDFTPSEYVEASTRIVAQVFETGRGGPYEKEYFRKDGSRTWLMFVAADLGDGTIVEYVLDISDRKRAEEALRESELLLRVLIQNLPGGAAFVLDRTLRYVLAEGEALSLAGFSSDDLVGKTLDEVLGPGMADHHRANYARGLAGESFVVEHDEHERSYVTRGTPLRSADGEVYAVLAVSYDITARRQAELAVHESEERFRLLIDGARDYAMFLLDPENRITFWSAGAERVFGWREAEVLGASAQIIFTPEDRAHGVAEQELATARAEGRALNRRWHVRKDGTRLFLDGALIRLDEQAGRERGFVKIGRDATVQRAAEEALQQAHTELEQRVEQRTAELLRLSTTRQELLQRLITVQEDERRRIARELHDSLGQYLSALTLDLARVQTLQGTPPGVRAELAHLQTLAAEIDAEMDRLTLELRPPALDDLGLEDALRHYVQQWGAASDIAVEVVTRGHSERLPLGAEATAYRVMQEALTNIRRHAQARHVSVILERGADVLRLIVEDDGVGFDPEAVARERSGGRQLGLVGMRERAALAGGTVTIESTPHNGTTIYLRIPLGGEQPAPWA